MEERRYTLNFIREIEKEKLYYYLLAASNPQPVLVVQSPLNETKKDRKEQQFLGYEWSNAKGREGIHYLNTGEIKNSKADDEDADDDTISQIMGIDGVITPLFNPLDLSDINRVNSLICGNFNGNSNEIPEELEPIVHEYALTDMLNFTRVEFDKELSTSVAYKLIFESKYPLVSLKKYVELNPSKSELKNMEDGMGVSFVEMSSVSENGYISLKEERSYKDVKGSYTYFADNDLIFAKITPCMENGKCAIATGLSNGIGFGSSEFHVFRCQNDVLNSYLFALLNTDEVRWYAKKNMKGSSGHRRVPEEFYASLEIPLPPMDVQKKIAEECEKIDMQMQQNKRQIRKMKEQAVLLFEQSLQKETTEVRLSQICDMRAGKFVPASEIVDKPMGKYIYPCYGGNGLRGFTDTMTNEGEYILIGRQGALCGNVCVASGQFHATEHAVVVYPNAEVDEKWLRYLLVHMDLNQYSTGRAQPGLSVQKILNVKANIPIDKNIQSQTAERILTIENEIAKLQYFVDSCPSAKQAILDKYLK